MENDGVFAPSEVSISNLSTLSSNQSRLEEQRICELYEIAAEAVDNAREMLELGYGIYEILSVLSELFSDAECVHTECLDFNLQRLRSYASFLGAYDKAVFSEIFLEEADKAGLTITENDFLRVYQGNGTFTYVKNPLADEAYDVFVLDFPEARLKYSKNLTEAARAVSSGEVEYCLLPLEERGGARLPSVCELLFREDLRINSVTPVFGFDGVADVKYALVSKHFISHEVRSDDDRYLEIRLRTDSSIPLPELLLASSALGASIYRVNTISFDTQDGQVQHYSVVFKDEGKDFSALLIFLTLFAGNYTAVGIYKNLE